MFSKNVFFVLGPLVLLALTHMHNNLKIVMAVHLFIWFCYLLKRLESYLILLKITHLVIFLASFLYLWPPDISRASLASIIYIFSILLVLILDLFTVFIKKKLAYVLSYSLLTLTILFNGFMFFELAF
jgi:hypothetical protein